MDKKKVIQIIVLVLCMVGTFFFGFLIGKQGSESNDKEKNPVQNEGNQNAEEDGGSYILIIDGTATDIGDDLVSAEKGCVMVKDSVVTDVLGFAKTVNEETKEVTYVLGTNSFTFYPDKTMYVYNNTTMESKQKCIEEDGVYTINVVNIFLDLDLLVNTYEGRMVVDGYYDCFAGYEPENKDDTKEENDKAKDDKETSSQKENTDDDTENDTQGKSPENKNTENKNAEDNKKDTTAE